MRHFRVGFAESASAFITASDESAARRIAARENGGDPSSITRIERSQFNPQLTQGADSEECERWLHQFVRDFGLGFHPDTPADEYVDDDGHPLDAEIVKYLDESVARVFEILGDDRPCEIGMEEFHGMTQGDQSD